MYGWYGLKSGDRLIVSKGKKKKKVTVVKEYPFFVLVDTGAYKTCLNKSLVYTKEAVLQRI